MLWGKKRWAALAAALLALADDAAAQTTPRAALGVPAVEATAPMTQERPPRDAASRPIPVAREVVPATSITPVALQRPVDPDDVEESYKKLIELAPPGRDRLFRLESETELFERIRVQRRLIRLPLEVPRIMPDPPPGPRARRDGETLVTFAEPSYLCYGRLFFEQRNAERYGWDLGLIQPPISAALFYADLLAWPLYWAVDPWRCFECNTGLCLPGDSTPLMLYWLRVK